MLLATENAWRFQPHPEVWLLVGAVVGLGWYAARVIAPQLRAAGHPAEITRRQKRLFILATVVLWVAADWPMHDIGEQYLYAVHMVQHTLLTMVMPPLFLLATPTWLAELIIGSDRVGRIVRTLTRPVVAGVAFNLLIALTHWRTVVDTSHDNGPFHYGVHLLLVTAALAAWVPIAGPLPERRLGTPGQLAYLFSMSIIPTIPAAWLTFSENPVYPSYDVAERVFGLDVINDQQMAGLIMKVGVGFYLWTLMAVLFFRWALRGQADDRRSRGVVAVGPDGSVRGRQARDGGSPPSQDALGDDGDLTWAEVQAELDRLGPAPVERLPGTPT